MCKGEFNHKTWGIGIVDHYHEKRGMFFETSYLLSSGRQWWQGIVPKKVKSAVPVVELS